MKEETRTTKIDCLLVFTIKSSQCEFFSQD